MNYISPIKHVLSVLVTVKFDDEAEVWVATSDDVPGLVAEHASLSELQNMVVELIPILLMENGLIPEGRDLPLEIPVHIAANANATSRRNVVVPA